MIQAAGAFVVVVPLAAVLTLMSIGWIAHERMATAQPAPVCGDERMQELARVQMFNALDTAFQDHVAGLYTVWIREISRAGQQRAAAGVDRGVSAYIHGRYAIEAWRLPRCRT